jgi:hypothetical protein
MAAEKLVAEARHAEAVVHLSTALEFWRSVGAMRYIAQAEALLGRLAQNGQFVGSERSSSSVEHEPPKP